jgi:hypothetical protein
LSRPIKAAYRPASACDIDVSEGGNG